MAALARTAAVPPDAHTAHADRPFSPWRVVEPTETPARGPLGRTWFAEFAPIYESLAQIGIAPRQADEMEVWEVASVLGMARPPDQQAPHGGDVRSEGARLVEERMRRHAQGLPPLSEAEAAAPSEAELARLSTLIPTND